MPSIVLRLGMKRAACNPSITIDDIDGKNRGRDDTAALPVAQNINMADTLQWTNPPAGDHNAHAIAPAEPNTHTTDHGPPASRLRPRRTPSPNSSRASSRAPTPSRKPRKPTKDSLLNGRRAFQKTRAWQQALIVATESLERREAMEQKPVPTERERVLAKRIACDQEKLSECMAEIWRLRGVVGALAQRLERERVPSPLERS